MSNEPQPSELEEYIQQSEDLQEIITDELAAELQLKFPFMYECFSPFNWKPVPDEDEEISFEAEGQNRCGLKRSREGHDAGREEK